jgi:hypothetical protein
MSDQICIGALAIETNQSLRLLEPDGRNHPLTTEYQVGQIWDITFTKRTDVILPHVEDVLVSKATFVREGKNVRDNLVLRVTPWRGEPSALYDRLIRFTQNGSGYICERVGIPSMSTGYWIADRPLVRADDADKVRYAYSVDWPPRILTYVGTGQPLSQIPSGTLLRVSLARWWQPGPDFESRCYLQLSGWFQ